MKRRPKDLEGTTFDVLVVGGGITGACLAFDAAARGMSVALVEKDDFGAATSAASSKLLHGGIRYLQQLKFRKVRESSAERVHFLNLAPHLCRWVPFVVPAYAGLRRGRPMLAAGMAAYRALCAGHNRRIRDAKKRVPAGRSLSPSEVREKIPGLAAPRLTGGRLFYELHMENSERMTLAFLRSAANRGAVVCNYLRADAFLLPGGRVAGVQATDRKDGERRLEIRARVVANAAGPWIGALNGKLERRLDGIITGFSRGAHIVTRPLTQDCAVALPTSRRSEAVVGRGGRHVFVIPWRGHSLIGTSYASHDGSLDAVAPTPEETAQLLDEVNAALGAGTLSEGDVRFRYAGLYPLLGSDIDPQVYQGTGDYQICDHERADGVGGLFSVFGAKFTTARLLAERALDRIAARLDRRFDRCRTRELVLDRADHQAGTDVTPAYAAEHEMACHLDDYVFRRTGMGTLGDPGLQALADAADQMGSVLGWDEETKRAEIARTRERFSS